jgi:hypothetical protein
MHRTQISLEPEHHAFLAMEARRLRVSIAEVVRRLVAERIAACRDQAEDPLDALAGFVQGDGSSVALEHDHYLYGGPTE